MSKARRLKVTLGTHQGHTRVTPGFGRAAQVLPIAISIGWPADLVFRPVQCVVFDVQVILRTLSSFIMLLYL